MRARLRAPTHLHGRARGREWRQRSTTGGHDDGRAEEQSCGHLVSLFVVRSVDQNLVENFVQTCIPRRIQLGVANETRASNNAAVIGCREYLTRNVGDVALGHARVLVEDPKLCAIHFGGANVRVGPQKHVLKLRELLVGFLHSFLLWRLLLRRSISIPADVLLDGKDVVVIIYDCSGCCRAFAACRLFQGLVRLLDESHRRRSPCRCVSTVSGAPLARLSSPTTCLRVPKRSRRRDLLEISNFQRQLHAFSRTLPRSAAEGQLRVPGKRRWGPSFAQA